MRKFTLILSAAALLALAAVGGAARAGSGDAEPSSKDALRESLRAYALANAGRAERGRAVLEGLSCLECHSLEPRDGGAVPSLAGVGGRLGRVDIAEQVLFPSRTNRGRHVQVTYSDGRVVKYRLLSDDKDRLTVRDPSTGGAVEIAKASLEGYHRVSSMPPGQADGLKPEEFAGLVEFLVSLK